MTFLLDNNVLSEIWRPKPDPVVLDWFYKADWYVPVPVIAEIQEVAEVLENERRRAFVNLKLDLFLRDYGLLVVWWDTETARAWGRLKHSREVRRKPQALWDSLIDAMAVAHNFTIATRNTRDFRHAKTFNPWLVAKS